MVPPTRRMTIGDRAFPVAGARVWNALPSFVTDSATVATFKRHLKAYLFARSLSSDRDLVRRYVSSFHTTTSAQLAVALSVIDYVQCSRSFLG